MSNRVTHSQTAAGTHPLDVCLEEIRSALQASDEGVNSLMGDFVEVAQLVDSLLEDARSVSDSTVSVSISNKADKIRAAMNSSVQSFQFYDRLTQQLQHVITLLEQVAASRRGDCPEAHRWHDSTPENYNGTTSVELF